MKTKVLWVLAGVGLIGYLIYLTMAPNVVSCEVCIQFRGRTACRRASGPDVAEAQRAATSTACSVLAGGIDDGIACQNTLPATSDCQGR